MPIYLLFMGVFAHCDKDSMTLKLKRKPLLSDPLLKKFANPCFKFKGNLLVLTVEDKVRVLWALIPWDLCPNLF